MADKVWVVAEYDREACGVLIDGWSDVAAFLDEDAAKAYMAEKNEYLRPAYNTDVARYQDMNDRLNEQKRVAKQQNKALKAAGAPLVDVPKGSLWEIPSFEEWLDGRYYEGWKVVEVELR